MDFARGSLLEHPTWSFASLPAATNANSYDGPFRLRRAWCASTPTSTVSYLYTAVRNHWEARWRLSQQHQRRVFIAISVSDAFALFERRLKVHVQGFRVSSNIWGHFCNMKWNGRPLGHVENVYLQCTFTCTVDSIVRLDVMFDVTFWITQQCIGNEEPRSLSHFIARGIGYGLHLHIWHIL